MKQQDQQIRALIRALNEEVNEKTGTIDYQELEKKTGELCDLLLLQKQHGAKQAGRDLFSGDNKQEDAIYAIGNLVGDSLKGCINSCRED